MAKILSITEEVIKVGTDDGRIIQVLPSAVSFEPRVGDEVNVYTDGRETIITQADLINRGNKTNTAQTDGQGNITINLSNDHIVQPTQAPQVAYASGKVVNKVVYIIFAIFLGGLGIHKFYAGKIGIGILYLVFFWTFIPSFLGLIEGIIAAFKPADAQGNIVV